MGIRTNNAGTFAQHIQHLLVFQRRGNEEFALPGVERLFKGLGGDGLTLAEEETGGKIGKEFVFIHLQMRTKK